MDAPSSTQVIMDFTDTRLPEPAKKRLGGQNGKVLELLRRGPATNIQLEKVCGRVNSRIADVRRYLRQNEDRTISSEPLDVREGIYQYEIETCS